MMVCNRALVCFILKTRGGEGGGWGGFIDVMLIAAPSLCQGSIDLCGRVDHDAAVIFFFLPCIPLHVCTRHSIYSNGSP